MIVDGKCPVAEGWAVTVVVAKEDKKEEKCIMKVAVSTLGKTMEDKIDPRFGRAQGFVFYDTESGDSEYTGNGENIALAQGAGTQTAQFIADKGVEMVISGHFGPKAAQVLQTAGIQMKEAEPAWTVKEAIEQLVKG
ncbi:MAG: dinitrogenase iron-molybdenum cofactor biosynthesis protein [Acidobacteria bacterium]|nr:MAG: dinitrogenase iron-molybdenum cofactor biosynthesis protein [Acidobacteriota bacterium]